MYITSVYEKSIFFTLSCYHDFLYKRQLFVFKSIQIHVELYTVLSNWLEKKINYMTMKSYIIFITKTNT